MRDILGFITYIFKKNIEFNTLNSENLKKNHPVVNKLHVFTLHLSRRNLVRKIKYFLNNI